MSEGVALPLTIEKHDESCMEHPLHKQCERVLSDFVKTLRVLLNLNF